MLFIKIVKFSWQFIFHGCWSKRTRFNFVYERQNPFYHKSSRFSNESEKGCKFFRPLLVPSNHRKNFSTLYFKRKARQKLQLFIDSSLSFRVVMLFMLYIAASDMNSFPYKRKQTVKKFSDKFL